MKSGKWMYEYKTNKLDYIETKCLSMCRMARTDWIRNKEITFRVRLSENISIRFGWDNWLIITYLKKREKLTFNLITKEEFVIVSRNKNIERSSIYPRKLVQYAQELKKS